ncbi:hypothetical protein OEZ71_13455 [Defluviimonas sp. WL0050]|uniref:Uncharacterized protein n=1 Tax=Albidovulum litorale TaxID=2984134 RepID=A0ABT2ZQ66_9RHOB|nr:hypothetical protein [Defluviimonas sp. WL0050]MCV2873300.1 hypothetical protein [Defluviimonas sp. WL0050]
MKLGRREERLVHRTFVLIVVAAVMGIGVVVIKENTEIQKLIEPSIARDLLLLIAPLAGLAMTGYSLASKTLSSGGFLSEFFALVGSYSIFIAVALPSFTKRELASGEVCSFWQLFCKETLLVRDHRITLVFSVVAVVLVAVSLLKAGIFRVPDKD